jgi:hypothetical protein
VATQRAASALLLEDDLAGVVAVLRPHLPPALQRLTDGQLLALAQHHLAISARKAFLVRGSSKG